MSGGGGVVPLGVAIAAKSNEEKGEPIRVTERRERRPLRDIGDGSSGLSGLFASGDYVRINVPYLNELSRRYHNDPIIRIVAEAVQSRVFSGKVRIHKTGAGGGEEKKAGDDLLSDQYSQIWSQWGMQILEQQDIWGFAVATFVSDEIHGFVPRVLNLLDGIEIRHRMNKFSEHLFAFYQHPTVSSGLGPSSLPLPNVYVFCATPPGQRGEIRSKVASLQGPAEHLDKMTQFSIVAESKRCNPVVMTEHMEYGFRTSFDDPAMSGSRYPRISSEQERCASLLDRLTKHANVFGVSSPGALLEKADHLMALLASPAGAPTHHLDSDRKYVAPQMAEPPIDLDKLRLSYQQLVMMQWGMPPGMMQAESTHGKIGHNEDARKIFDENVRSIKDKVAGYIADMYHIMWDKVLMERAILSTPLHERLTERKLVSATHVEVSIPGRPSEVVYTQLYREGTLKWEHYKRYQAGMHSIPLDAFEEKPGLSRIDLLTEGQESIERQKGKISITNREREIKEETKAEKETTAAAAKVTTPAKKKAKKKK
jgi:hypothetical protein